MATNKMVRDLTPDQWDKVRQFWSKLDILAQRGDNTAGTESDSDTDRTDSGDEADAAASSNKTLREIVAKYSGKELREALWNQLRDEDPDALIVRFLKWRRWNVDDALATAVGSMQWRVDEKVVPELIAGGDVEWKRMAKEGPTAREQKTGEECMRQLRSGKFFCHGTDKEGRPLLFVRVKRHFASDQDLASLLRFSIYCTETVRMMLSSSQTTVSLVFDMTNFSISNMDYNAVRLFISGLADNYPAGLHSIYVVRAPWIFNGIWAVIKGWLPDVIKKRVRFMSKTTDLKDFISLDCLPKHMGGNEDWEYEYIEPSPLEINPLRLDEAQEAEKQALKAEREALIATYTLKTTDWGLGRTAQEQALTERHEVLGQIQSNYWRLDRYVRARTVYDRAGVIGADGAYAPEKWSNAA